MNAFLPKGGFARRICDELIVVVFLGLIVWALGRYWWQLAATFVAVGVVGAVVRVVVRKQRHTYAAKAASSVGTGLVALATRAFAPANRKLQEELRAERRLRKEAEAKLSEFGEPRIS